MNWTGGRLQRHSTTSRGTTARQKQHFAQIQKNLGSRRKLFTTSHAIKDIGRLTRNALGMGSITSHSVHKDHPQFRKAHEDIPSLLTRHNVRQLSVPNRAKEISPIAIGRNASPTYANRHDAIPPPSPKVDLELAKSSSKFEHTRSLDESLSEKRRRLLERDDWLGVNIQARVGVKFVASEITNVGKRRNVSSGHRAHYQSKEKHILSPFVSKRRRLTSPGNADIMTLHDKSNVRITLGGKTILPGIGSSSIATREDIQTTKTHTRSITESSDIMLLDDGNRLKLGASVDQRQDSLIPDCRSSYASTMYQETKVFECGYRELLKHPPRVFSGSEPQQKRHKDMGNLAVSSNPQEESHSSSEYLHPRRYFNDEGEEVFSSEITFIEQPVPKSFKIPCLLRSHSSELYHNNLSQLGDTAPLLSKSCILEDEVWPTCVTQMSPGIQKCVIGIYERTHHLGRETSISSGISNIPTNHEDDEMQLSSSDESQSYPLEFPKHDKGQPPVSLEDLGTQDSCTQPEGSQEKLLGLCINPTDSNTSYFPSQKVIPAEVMSSRHRMTQNIQESADEIWRKFVFPSSSMESQSFSL
jgi:hypothetical protein